MSTDGDADAIPADDPLRLDMVVRLQAIEHQLSLLISAYAAAVLLVLGLYVLTFVHPVFFLGMLAAVLSLLLLVGYQAVRAYKRWYRTRRLLATVTDSMSAEERHTLWSMLDHEADVDPIDLSAPDD